MHLLGYFIPFPLFLTFVGVFFNMAAFVPIFTSSCLTRQACHKVTHVTSVVCRKPATLIAGGVLWAGGRWVRPAHLYPGPPEGLAFRHGQGTGVERLRRKRLVWTKWHWWLITMNAACHGCPQQTPGAPPDPFGLPGF